MLIKPGTKVSLKDYDPADTGALKSADEAEEVLGKHIAELESLQNLLYAENRHTLLVPPNVWKKRYKQINHFERSLV